MKPAASCGEEVIHTEHSQLSGPEVVGRVEEKVSRRGGGEIERKCGRWGIGEGRRRREGGPLSGGPKEEGGTAGGWRGGCGWSGREGG